MSLASDIVRRVAEKHRVSLRDLGGSARFDYIVRARHEAMWTLAQVMVTPTRARYSTTQIGGLVAVGRKPFTHWTVLHGISRHQQRIDAARLGVSMPRSNYRPQLSRGTPPATNRTDRRAA